jgi:hypothetical protein
VSTSPDDAAILIRKDSDQDRNRSHLVHPAREQFVVTGS